MDAGIVVPGGAEQEFVPRGMERTQAPAPVRRVRPVEMDSLSLAKADSIAKLKADSVRREVNHHGLVLTDPYADDAEQPHTFVSLGVESWVFALLAMLFSLICFKFKNSPRYLSTLMSDMVSTRVRGNMFDNTVRETSYLIILNTAWAVCAGILVWCGIAPGGVLNPAQYGFTIPDSPLGGIGICVASAAVYLGVMLLMYLGVGNTFSDKNTTSVWVRGASACYALQTFGLLPLALLGLCYPQWSSGVLIAAGVVYAAFKILFIYKGIRIFLRQNISWLIFLYYLCSLEIVPLILTYVAILQICSNWL